MDFAVSADLRVKIIENKRIDENLDLARELKKAVEYEHDGYTNYCWHVWNSPQRLGNGTGRVGNQRTNRDHLNYSIM